MSVLAIDTRGAYDDVARVYAPIAAVVFVLVVGAIGWFVWRGRRRARSGGADERPVAEAVYVGVLVAIVAVLVAVTFTAQGRIEAATGTPGVAVRVTAAKWNWRFDYPGRHRDQPAGRARRPTLVVPAGREVRFPPTSLDVLHGFWIPDRRFQ